MLSLSLRQIRTSDLDLTAQHVLILLWLHHRHTSSSINCQVCRLPTKVAPFCNQSAVSVFIRISPSLADDRSSYTCYKIITFFKTDGSVGFAQIDAAFQVLVNDLEADIRERGLGTVSHAINYGVRLYALKPWDI
jgi:hypothetical protein